MTLTNLLIIDDSEADQFYAKIILEDFDDNIKIAQVYNGEEGIKHLESCEVKPDLILLDINMPVMNGHEFLAEYAHKTGTETPSTIVMLTSSGNPRDKEQCEKYDCVIGFMSKPVDINTIENIVDSA